MTGITLAQPRAPEAPRLPLFQLIMLFLAVAAVIYGTHAVLRHGQAAEEIRRCIEQNGPLETWSNPLTGRNALICKLPNGLFALQICEDDHEVTCIPQKNHPRLEQVYRYLKNRGYKR